jgi:hypothetical protein
MCEEQAEILYSASFQKDLPAFEQKTSPLTGMMKGIALSGKEV